MYNVKEQKNRQVAAIDLGSNSFHMVVAKIVGNGLQIESRHKQRVQLAKGLDQQSILDEDAIQRGLDCLTMFAERLSSFEIEDVRITATHALRQAANASNFIVRAYKILPFPIEVISGSEEARLIYLGVTHTQPEAKTKLVIDIGGGSTELIIGQQFEPKLVNSKQMGCVSYTQRFFSNGKLNKKNFAKADLAAKQHLGSIAEIYKKSGWDTALGSSGTIKAIREVLIAMGYDDGIITAKRLEKLIEALHETDTIDNIDLEGLNDDRKPVFAAGVAILNAVFDELKIKSMHFSDGALREGLLYEMEDRFKRSDIRMRTTESLAKKHSVDLAHAEKVRQQACEFYEQIDSKSGLEKTTKLVDLLGWAAMLHEVGLSINYQAFHRHSYYILRYSNMPGFNQEQQLLLATLARFQRKSLKIDEMPEFNMFKRKEIIPIIRVLRLAIILNAQRREDPLPHLTLKINDEEHWKLKCEDTHWLDENKLLEANLLNEQAYWKQVEWSLSF